MSLRDRLRSVRAFLVAGVALRALTWGVATALTLIVGAALIAMLGGVLMLARVEHPDDVEIPAPLVTPPGAIPSSPRPAES
jgi:hypothetical protein